MSEYSQSPHRLPAPVFEIQKAEFGKRKRRAQVYYITHQHLMLQVISKQKIFYAIG